MKDTKTGITIDGLMDICPDIKWTDMCFVNGGFYMQISLIPAHVRTETVKKFYRCTDLCYAWIFEI